MIEEPPYQALNLNLIYSKNIAIEASLVDIVVKQTGPAVNCDHSVSADNLLLLTSEVLATANRHLHLHTLAPSHPQCILRPLSLQLYCPVHVFPYVSVQHR